MIHAKFLIGKKKLKIKLFGHGDPIVCAAVSALSINAVNSLEKLSKAVFTVKTSADGFLTLNVIEIDQKSVLLIKSLLLGLQKIAEEHPNDLIVTVKKLKDWS